jgi:hypothetical protein
MRPPKTLSMVSPRLHESVMRAYALRFVKRLKMQPGTDGCWEWTGHRDKKGYGQFWWNGRMWWAHRWVYEALKQLIPAGLTLHHKCFNHACCRPDHLVPKKNEKHCFMHKPKSIRAYRPRVNVPF